MTAHATDTKRAVLLKGSDVGSLALIVIDMQNDFCAAGGYFDHTGADLSAMEPMADRLASCIEAARNAGVMVIFVRSAYDPIFLSEAQNNRRRRVGWDIPLCGRGTWGYEFYRVAPLQGEPIVTKHRFDAFYGTDLELILRSNGKRQLIFAGVATNVCVETSLRSAFIRDFEVILLADCTAARTGRAHEATLESVQYHFGLVAMSSDIERVWSEKSRNTI
jgi:ureidoacrylate peracid hydrolase